MQVNYSKMYFLDIFQKYFLDRSLEIVMLEEGLQSFLQRLSFLYFQSRPLLPTLYCIMCRTFSLHINKRISVCKTQKAATSHYRSLKPLYFTYGTPFINQLSGRNGCHEKQTRRHQLQFDTNADSFKNNILHAKLEFFCH